MPRVKRTVVTSPGLARIRATKGLQSELARHLGVTRQAISDWPEVPITRLIEVERFTGISRESLRPELYQHRRRSHT